MMNQTISKLNRFLMSVSTAMFAHLCASAAVERVDGIDWCYEVSHGEASLQRNGSDPCVASSTTGNVTVPAVLGGCPVTDIGFGAFRGCSTISGVTIASSVKTIGNYAFSGCAGLQSISLPLGVEVIAKPSSVELSGDSVA